MFFNSIKEINASRKEINRLLSKGMPNIYLKVTIETFLKLRFSGFKKFVARSVFEELQLAQISLNFKTSCCKVWEQNCMWLFYYFHFERNYDVLKVKESMHFVEQKHEF